VVDSLRTLIGAGRMVLVDAGNIHGFQRTEQAGREAAFIVEMMNRQKYDAAVLGPKDWGLPDSTRTRLLGGAAFPWLSTNLAESMRPKGVQEVWIKKVDGLKVGLFSWIDPNWQANNMKAEELQDNLEATAKDLRGRCDVVAMVAYTNLQDPQTVARRVNGLVDVMILGGVNAPDMAAKKEGSVNIGNSGDRGRHIARFDLLLNREKKIVNADYQVVVLGSELPVDPAVAQLMEDFKGAQERLKFESLEKLRLAKLKELKIDPATMPGENSTLTYTGEKDCRDCHKAQYDSWRQSVHGRAFSDLIRNRESEQDDKVRRAVTGWMEKSGFVDRRESSQLYNVQCESCHGRGSEHVKTKGAALETLVKPETTCLSCHDAQHSPDFKLAESLKLSHPPLPPTPPDASGAVPALAPGDKIKVANIKEPVSAKPSETPTIPAKKPVNNTIPPPPPATPPGSVPVPKKN
jgi:hypothetical protein